MFNTYRRSAARLAAAGIATGLLAAGAVAGAGSAVADDTTPSSSGATAVLSGIQGDLSDLATVATKDGKTNDHEPAGLFKMDLGGGKSFYSYCIDLFNTTKPDAQYQEVPWSATSLYQEGKDRANAGKIAWILNHSFPQVDDLDGLAKTAGAGPLTKKTAAAGTQVAIWRLSDDPTAKANDPAAEQLADYLSHTAVAVAEPDASLTLDPPSVSGKSGDRIGPVTVHTNADSAAAEITPDTAGVKLVDADGKTVTTAKDGSKLYFDIPAGTKDGNAAVKVTATTTVPIGRAFIGFGANDAASQTQILAGSDTTPLTAQATVTWAKKGPIPAVSAAVNCAKGGVDVTAANKGDEDLTFTLGGKDYSVAPGASKTVTVPVAEDQHYKIDITLPDKSVKSFEGVLDCKSATTAPTPPANQPSPAGSDQNLAATGSSSSTPMIAGIAVALVVLGGGAVFFFRRKKSATSAQ
ncbi:LAETG motif-containing sortase-dependent surface protein [Streptomyces sp. NBC_01477]|uniref:LAETG motif-containing sortase-dependent surface protein n=1 Tax=Streptomyces sp. NBC_01477 TaxID=2976015 RepID=UPI002E33F19A|nr:LAETG motif-containing sortase-dependent surface protein [Streptomyces sp. NBC_01477]